MSRPASGQVVIRDGKRGRVFGIRYRANGRRVYETVGTEREGTTDADAKNMLEDRLAAVRLGIWRDPDEIEMPGEPERVPLFADFATAFVRGCEEDGLGARTIEDYRWAVELHLVPVLGRLRLDEIGVPEVDAYRRAKASEGVLSPNSVNKTITRLSQILSLAVEHGHIGANPAAGRRRRMKRTSTRQTWCAPSQLMVLLEGAEGLLFGRGRPLLATLAGAGLRIGEALGLTWADIDLDRAELVVRKSKTEAGERTVDLTPALRGELADWRGRTRFARPSDYVFPNGKSGQDNRNNVRRRLLEPAIKKANRRLVELGIAPITDLTPHGLRRTYGSLRHAVGDEAVYTATQIGHADATFTLNVYTVAAKRLARMSETERTEAERAFAWASWTPATGTSAQSGSLHVVEGVQGENAQAA